MARTPRRASAHQFRSNTVVIGSHPPHDRERFPTSSTLLHHITLAAFAGPDTSSRAPNSTVSLNCVIKHRATDGHTRGTAGAAPRPTPATGTSSRSTRRRDVQDALGAPRGVKPLGKQAGRRKASGSGGECAKRSAARKAYAAIHKAAWW